MTPIEEGFERNECAMTTDQFDQPATGPEASAPPPNVTPTNRWRVVALVEAAFIAVVLVIGAVVGIGTLIKPDLAQVAQDHGFATAVGDEESVSLRIYGSAGDMAELCSMLDDLGLPSGTMSRIEGTRALDGTQDAEGDGVEASWAYHPDNGLRIVIMRQ